MTKLDDRDDAPKPLHIQTIHLQLSGPFESDGGPAKPLPIAFETAERRLRDLERLYFEGDGSFVWAPQDTAAPSVGGIDGPSTQVFGMIYDAADAIRYIEIRGRCTAATLIRLVRTLIGDGEASMDDSSAGNLPQWGVLVLPDGQRQDLQTFVDRWDDGK